MGNREEMEKLGFKEGAISECIVTTFNEDHSPNAAPIGVVLKDGKAIMKLHTFSDTYRNLIKSNCCVLNIVFDPFLFLKTAIVGQGKGKDELEIETKQVAEATHIEAPYISDADAYIELKLRSHEEREMHDRHGKAKVSIVRCEIESINVIKEYPLAINRGLFAAIELAILLSRGEKKGARRYLQIMKKTLDNEEYNKIEKLLEGRL
ncbi:MAG: DUF447 domain-containing protein [Candidatus Hydrothermarchaeales archaeon]